MIPTVYFFQDEGQQGTSRIHHTLVDACAMLPLTANEFVLKPCISAGSHKTLRFSAVEAADPTSPAAVLFAELQREQVQCMLQPFLADITSNGEYSVVVMDGVVSHVVRKVPKEGDFRVQCEFGGCATIVPVTEELTDAALEALSRIQAQFPDEPILYARVDLVSLNGRWCVMEVELIEPQLFFDRCPEAALKLAEAVRKYIA